MATTTTVRSAATETQVLHRGSGTPERRTAPATTSDAGVAVVAAPQRAAPAQQPPPHLRIDPAKLSYDQRRAIVMGSFTGGIERVPVTLRYRLAALVSAAFMILLPLLYVGVIGLILFGVGWHAVRNADLLSQLGGDDDIAVLLGYLLPIALGAVIVFFLTKPLFARQPEQMRTRSLTAMSDPLLFEFVEHLCSIVRAPMPKRIDINCDVNASARFRRGWLSVFGANDLVLTLGMPLVANLTAQQLAGVIAHELGHFAQGAGTRLTYISHRMFHWLVEAVYGRDSWDAWIARVSDSLGPRLSWVLFPIRGFIWLTRKMLWVLLFVGHAISSYLLRQMEFDADRYEARVAGSGIFEATTKQLSLLMFAFRGAQFDLRSFATEGRLADDLPKLIRHNINDMPDEVKRTALEMTETEKTSMFDTHPSPAERIGSAHAEQAPGIFHCPWPASILFENFEAASKGVTIDLYHQLLGFRIPPNAIRPVEELVAKQESVKEAAEARERFFLSPLSTLRPLLLPTFYIKPAVDPHATKREIGEQRELMFREAAQYRDYHAAYDKLDDRLHDAVKAQCLMSNNLKPPADMFDPPFTHAGQARQEWERCRLEMTRLGNQMEVFENAAGRRLHGALSLLMHPAVASRMKDSADLQRECEALLPVVSVVCNHLASILDLRDRFSRIVVLVRQLQAGKRSDSAARDVFDNSHRMAESLRSLHSTLSQHEYPFDHADGKISVARFLLRVPPPGDEIGAVLDSTDQFVSKLLYVYSRCVSRLGEIAEITEKRLGFKPLSVRSSE